MQRDLAGSDVRETTILTDHYCLLRSFRHPTRLLRWPYLVPRRSYPPTPEEPNAEPHSNRRQGCCLHIGDPGVPHRRGSRTGGQRIEGPSREAYHTATLATCDSRRRGARQSGPCHHCRWWCLATHPQDADQGAKQEEGLRVGSVMCWTVPLSACEKGGLAPGFLASSHFHQSFDARFPTDRASVSCLF